VSHKADELAARRAWKGPRERYDLIFEGLVALVVTAVLVVGLAAVFGSPTIDAVTYESWSKADPADFVTTQVSELNGTSETATYGQPYNDTAGAAQAIGPFSPQAWTGVTIPIDAADAFVVAPLRRLGALDASARTALATWDGADASQQAAWGTAAGKAKVKLDGTTVKLEGEDSGPIAAMMTSLLVAAQAGVYDAAMVDNPSGMYGNDHTRSLLNIEDGGYLGDLGTYYVLTGEDWGIMNEIGNWPGQPWLWWYTMMYNVPGPIRGALDYSDIAAVAFALPLLALVAFLPWIPGLRRLPRYLRVYRLIWRDYYRTYGSSRKPRG
jgi:hypothetical protein